MDLKSGYPYWTVKNGLLAHFPPLDRDVGCDVAVIGAGITGALIAHSLCEAGLDVVVLDKRDAGWGSTSASTALLQYEIDGGMLDIAKRYGEARAAEVFKACEQALHTLEPIARGVRGADFHRNQSLYYASWPWHAGSVRDEGAMRRRHGFSLDVLERAELHERFGIDASVALLTKVAGRMDPQRVAVGVLAALAKRGCGVFDRTAVEHWETAGNGLRVVTDRGSVVRCRHLVVAAGYEAHAFLRARVARNHSSYALVTEPLADPPRWLSRTLVWESRQPYLYLRDAGEGRVLVGGEDDLVDIAAKRDRAVPKKTRRLVAKLSKLLGRDDLEVGFAWAGTFAETADALPYFGPHAEHGPRVHFAMAYGGNGIVYSTIGAELIRARILREKHALTRFLSFERAG
jgi:glycine/D-amino acid oxidase-like deaminating enzyme